MPSYRLQLNYPLIIVYSSKPRWVIFLLLSVGYLAALFSIFLLNWPFIGQCVLWTWVLGCWLHKLKHDVFRQCGYTMAKLWVASNNQWQLLSTKDHLFQATLDRRSTVTSHWILLLFCLPTRRFLLPVIIHISDVTPENWSYLTLLLSAPSNSD